jgi:hypothetical protein
MRKKKARRRHNLSSILRKNHLMIMPGVRKNRSFRGKFYVHPMFQASGHPDYYTIAYDGFGRAWSGGGIIALPKPFQQVKSLPLELANAA